MKKRILSTGLALAFFLGVCAAALSGQNITATLTGTVTDTSGAIVPNATVTVHSNDTNTDVRTVNADQAGAYTVPDLPVGTYKVTVTAPNFKSFVATDVVLHVGDHRTLDASLQVGQVNETVNVTSTEAPVETASAAQSTTITGPQVRELQLNNRNFIQLVALQPGVSSTEGDQVGFGGISATLAVSVNGNRTSANNWTVDGADINDSGSNLTIVNVPSIDALTEFKLERSTYDAEYGRSGGGQVNVVTKSGTSDFHGDAYEFVRNDIFNANTFLGNKANLKKPPFRYNNFGYTIGGPVWIPKIYQQKDKTFFFFSQEFRRTKTPSSVIALVPNPQELTGNFQGIATLNAASAPVGCITGNQISPTCFSANAKVFIANVYSKFTPDAGCAPTALTCNATSTISPINNTRQEIVRLDHKITDKIQVFGRYMQDKIPTTEPGGLFAGSPLVGISSTATNAPGRNVVAHVTAQLTPTIVNETAYNYSWGAINSNLTGVINSPAFVGALTNNLPFTDPYKRVPGVTFPTGNVSGVAIPSAPYFERNIDKNLYDDVAWVRGVHTFRFGFAAQWMRKSENAVNPTDGSFNFRNQGGNPAVAEFLLGEAQSFGQSARDIIPNLHFLNLEFYGQDDWKLRPNFTLNLGVRYSFFQNPHDDNPILDNFDPTVFNSALAPSIDAKGNFVAGQGVIPATYANGIIVATNGCSAAQALISGSPAQLTCSPFGGQVNPSYKKSIAPRVGFAWDPFRTGKTSVRGGYGIYFDRTLNGIWEQNSFVLPPIVQSVNINNAANGAGVFANLFDNPASGTTAIGLGPLSLHSTGSPGFFVPYSQNWNLSVQREVLRNTLVEVAYVGSKGTHLLGEEDFNQVPLTARFLPANATADANALRPYRGYGPITSIVNIFDSNYNSLQASVIRRVSRGLTLSISYTLSRTLTDSPTDRSTAPYDTYNRSLDYGPANFSRNNIFVADYVYDLPFYREQHGVVGHILGGWELSGITVFESGVPLTITQFNDPFSSNDFGAGAGLFPHGIGIDPSVVSPRPDFVLGQNPGGPKTANQWLNTKAWTDAIGHFGDSGRGVLTGPGFNNWDLAAIKNIRIIERVNAQFRAEFFNAFNHPSFLGVSTNVDSSSFGQVTSTHDPRIIQFGLKLNF